MSQFDVYKLRDGQLIVDCQAEMFEHFKTRFVVPLVNSNEPKELAVLHPTFEIEGKTHIFATHLGSAVPVSQLGNPIASLSDSRYVILNALDTLTGGF